MEGTKPPEDLSKIIRLPFGCPQPNATKMKPKGVKTIPGDPKMEASSTKRGGGVGRQPMDMKLRALRLERHHS